jgi:beta-glucanase (GH16 family)
MKFDEEFSTPLDLTTAFHQGTWRANDFWQNVNTGYRDFGGGSWNINPNQSPRFSPFQVRDGFLTISAIRTPPELKEQLGLTGISAIPGWAGGQLVTEMRRNAFLFGYFEFRARWPNGGRGMFPAIWLYVADGTKSADKSKSGAEIDILEILGFSDGMPWTATVHQRDYLGRGSQKTLGSYYLDTTNWHVYGLDWQPSWIRLFRDGKLVGELSGAAAAWFDVPMSIHLNYAMDGKYLVSKGRGSSSATPDPLLMQIDYVRVYEHRPTRSCG